jgi:hypothetical protein
LKIFAGAGPYAAYGLGGKNKIEGSFLGAGFSDEDDIDYSNDNPRTGNNGSRYQGSLKRFDFGVNLLAGVEINHVMFNVGYGYGLVNIRPGSDNDNGRYRNRVASASIGFLF